MNLGARRPTYRGEKQGAGNGRFAREILLERADGARCRQSQEVLRGHFGLELRRDPDYSGVPEGWMPYVAVDDVDARAKKAVAAGAKIMKPAFDVPNVGRIVILQEPGGAGVGWMTPAS